MQYTHLGILQFQYFISRRFAELSPTWGRVGLPWLGMLGGCLIICCPVITGPCCVKCWLGFPLPGLLTIWVDMGRVLGGPDPALLVIGCCMPWLGICWGCIPGPCWGMGGPDMLFIPMFMLGAILGLIIRGDIIRLAIICCCGMFGLPGPEYIWLALGCGPVEWVNEN